MNFPYTLDKLILVSTQHLSEIRTTNDRSLATKVKELAESVEIQSRVARGFAQHNEDLKNTQATLEKEIAEKRELQDVLKNFKDHMLTKPALEEFIKREARARTGGPVDGSANNKRQRTE